MIILLPSLGLVGLAQCGDAWCRLATPQDVLALCVVLPPSGLACHLSVNCMFFAESSDIPTPLSCPTTPSSAGASSSAKRGVVGPPKAGSEWEGTVSSDVPSRVFAL